MADLLPYIPATITVHLGAPSSNAANVTVSFPDYIKNVASSEVFPTWPENSLRANIHAQISFALNRVYTEFYYSQGYDFQITNLTAFDQAFVDGRNFFENVSRIVDEIFNTYIRRIGRVEPLFAAYCDGIRVSCDGLSQWGSVSLAENGFSPIEILRNYYGEDIEIVTNVPVRSTGGSAPEIPLQRGSVGNDVQLLQVRLNRISSNFPEIPKIYPVNGIFNVNTENAVRTFQRLFGLSEDGVVGPSTWYSVLYVYNGVKRLSDLNSEGLLIEELPSPYPNVLSEGEQGVGVRVLQYYLNYIAQFVNTVPSVTIDGDFGPETRAAVLAFQRAYGLTPDGIVGPETWDVLYNTYLGMIASVPPVYVEGRPLPFPGNTLTLNDSGEDVRLLQEYLSFIAQYYPEIPAPNPDGVFGPVTEAAVIAFQRIFAPSLPAGVVGAAAWDIITTIYEDLYLGSRVSTGQYPGYTIG